MIGPRHRRGPLGAGLVILLLLGAAAIAAPLLATSRPLVAEVEGALRILPDARDATRVVIAAPIPHDPLAVDVTRALESPSAAHLLGTDALGRDVLARMLHGARNSFGAGLLATLIAATIAVALGSLPAFVPLTLDELVSRIADVFNAFPVLVGAVALIGSGLLGPELPSAARVGVVVGLFAWPPLFRFVRAEVLRLRDSDFAACARAAGARPGRVALRHLVPLSLAPVLVPTAFVAAGTVLAEAGLGFLGLGVGPPSPSWGNLLRDGMVEMRSAWWLSAFPGLAVFLTVLGFHLLAEGLGGRRLARTRLR